MGLQKHCKAKRATAAIDGMVNRLFVTYLLCLVAFAVAAQDSLNVGVSTNIRALSIPGANDWWFGGSKGWLGHSTDGGKNWVLRQPLGASVDFRNVHAFNDKEAVAAVAGQPAVIFRTEDGGSSWREVYRNADSLAFFDAFGFWNANEGVLFGDPLADGRMLLLFTQDGGRSWLTAADSMRPLFAPGEAAFAASGTAMQCSGDSTLALVSGGAVSRLWFSTNRGRTWDFRAGNKPNPALYGEHANFPDTLPPEKARLYYGAPSRGGFSLALTPDSMWAVVGGDYQNEAHAQGHFAVFGYNQWWGARQATRGYRECLLVMDTMTWLATGPSGSDISWDGGLTWQPFLEAKGMHVIKNNRAGGVLLAGRGGTLWHFANLSAPVPKIWQPKTHMGKAVYANDMNPLKKRLVRSMRKNGKGKKNQRGTSFQHANKAMVALLQQTEGVEHVWVDSCSTYNAIYPGFGNVSFRANTKFGPKIYTFDYRTGKVYRHGYWRHLIGLPTSSERLSSPTFGYTPLEERFNHIECEFRH